MMFPQSHRLWGGSARIKTLNERLSSPQFETSGVAAGVGWCRCQQHLSLRSHRLGVSPSAAGECADTRLEAVG